MPEALLPLAIKAASRNDEDKLSGALQRLAVEDTRPNVWADGLWTVTFAATTGTNAPAMPGTGGSVPVAGAPPVVTTDRGIGGGTQFLIAMGIFAGLFYLATKDDG